MRRKPLIILSLIALLFAGVFAWAFLQPSDPIFHGKPESEWITNILYGVSTPEDKLRAQIEQWQGFGPDGLRVLERALDQPTGRKYSKFYSKLSRVLPGSVMRLLPDPKPIITGGPRHLALDLLCRLGTNAWPIWHSVARHLADEDDYVRGTAITFFTVPEDQRALLSHLSAKEKKELLPLFIENAQNMTSPYWPARNNAILALRYYPEESLTLAPILTKAMQETNAHVRLRAAEALSIVDPEAAKKAGAAASLLRTLRNGGELSYSAGRALHYCQGEADLVVPALIEIMSGTNNDIACQALCNLEWYYPKQKSIIIPAMEKAAERQDNVGNYAKSALMHLK